MLIKIYFLILIIVFYSVLEHFLVKEKYQFIFRLIKYYNDKKINNLIKMAKDYSDENKINVTKKDLEIIVKETYQEKESGYDALAITIVLTALGYIYQVESNINIIKENPTLINIIGFMLICLLVLVIILNEKLNYKIREKIKLEIYIKNKDKWVE